MREKVACIEQRFRRCREAILHAHDERPESRPVEHTFLDQIEREVQVTGIEDLQLGFDARFAYHTSHAPHILRRIDHYITA